MVKSLGVSEHVVNKIHLLKIGKTNYIYIYGIRIYHEFSINIHKYPITSSYSNSPFHIVHTPTFFTTSSSLFHREKPVVLHVFRCKNHGFHHGFSQHFPNLSQDSTGRLPGNGPRSLSCSVHGCWRAAPHGRRSGTAPRVDSPGGLPALRWNGGTVERLALQLWPEIPVISTNKIPFIECIIP